MRADDPDPWFGRDKMLHFGASAVLAGGGYAAGTALFDARYEALLLGGGVALTAGATKELADMAGAGTPSWRDFAWDVVGTAVGLGLAWGVDLALRGTSQERPALGSSRSALQGGVVVTF